MAIPDIVAWGESRSGFYIPETKAPIKLASHQAAILRHVLTLGPDGRLPYSEVIWSGPKKSGKTTIAALVAEYFGLFIESPNEVYLCANDLEQSQGRVYKALSQSVKLNRHLTNRADVQVRITRFDNGTELTALPSDYAGAAGSNHGLSIFDELWAYVSENSRRLWDEMTPPPTRRLAMRLTVTYAGFEGESELLEEFYKRGQKGDPVPDLAHIENGEGQPACRANGRLFVYWDHQLKRYPGLTIAPDDYHAQQREDLRPLAYTRLHENKFTVNESRFITKEQWEACYDPELRALSAGDGRKAVFGADASTTRDLTALVGVYSNSQAKTSDIVFCKAWKPERGVLRLGKPTVDLDETIGKEVERLHKAGQISAIVADPYQMHTLIIKWEKMGIRVIELPQTAARVEADQAFYDAIIGRTVRHYNHPDLNEHSENAIAVETARGFRLAKEKTRKKIDLMVAASQAHYGATGYQVQDPAGEMIDDLPREVYMTYEDQEIENAIAGVLGRRARRIGPMGSRRMKN